LGWLRRGFPVFPEDPWPKLRTPDDGQSQMPQQTLDHQYQKSN